MFSFYSFFLLNDWIDAVDREIEKLKLSEMTCREGVLEVAKMWALQFLILFLFFLACMYFCQLSLHSIYFSLFSFESGSFGKDSIGSTMFGNPWLLFSPSLLNPC
jgi:hypothetical protein